MSHFFVSYSHSDKQRVMDLVQQIEGRHFPIWIDKNIGIGDNWSRELANAIKSSVGLIVMMSPSSAGSIYVEAELLLARELDKQIFPILIGTVEKEDFWLLKPIQHEDLRGGKNIPDRLFDKLASSLHADPSSQLTEAEKDRVVMRVSQDVHLWERQRSDIADYLKQNARQDNMPLTYATIAKVFGFNLQNPAERNRLAGILGNISEIELNAGRPLLSAMVVSSNPDAPYPGKGFYQLARSLKPKEYTTATDNIVIYGSELKAIKACYQEQ